MLRLHYVPGGHGNPVSGHRGGQFQRNGHDIQTVFCTLKPLTEELAGSKHFSLSLSGTYKYQKHTHKISSNFIERF